MSWHLKIKASSYFVIGVKFLNGRGSDFSVVKKISRDYVSPVNFRKLVQILNFHFVKNHKWQLEQILGPGKVLLRFSFERLSKANNF